MKEEESNDEDLLEFEDFALQLADMLEAALYFAGAKKNKLQEASECYLECLDDLFSEEDPEIGVNEIIEVIKHLKKKHPEFF